MEQHKIQRIILLRFFDGANIAMEFAHKSPKAKQSAKMLGPMVNDPEIRKSQLSAITVPTLVIAETRDIIKVSHTREIASSIRNGDLKLGKGISTILQRYWL